VHAWLKLGSLINYSVHLGPRIKLVVVVVVVVSDYDVVVNSGVDVVDVVVVCFYVTQLLYNFKGMEV